MAVLASVLIAHRAFGLPGPVERVNVSSAGVPANADSSSAPSFSNSGRFVAFASSANNLVAGDTNSKVDVFVRDRTAGTTERVSVASDGTQADGDSA
ncbi:MAG: hypothetical protein M3066_01755, partial [Actinomycetota bacterium]|nr:hypothetical protein [Actinomycetota bacterium]